MKSILNRMKKYRLGNSIRWLLVAIFLTSCTGGALSSVTPSAEVVEAPVSVATAAPATVTPTATPQPTATPSATPTATATPTPTALPWSTEPHPLQIAVMRQQSYPGSPITFEQTLAAGANYSRYVVSYLSDGLKIYALMTVPYGTEPDTGWPVIIFNHGYIPPAQYRTTERYVSHVDTIARNGYIVFKSDYRGHGSSEGGDIPGGGYGTPAYTNDILNAVASLKAYEDADPNRIGMWGHSMGGQVTLRAMVVSQDIKAGVIWSGAVAPYPDIIARWDFMGDDSSPSEISQSARNWGQRFSDWVKEFRTQYGSPYQNPDFWATISPNTYLDDLSGPLELHHSTTDDIVPVAWSRALVKQLQAVDKQPCELYTYPGDNHNISANFGVAMQRSVDFFDEYVK